jgi:hypothetical protein
VSALPDVVRKMAPEEQSGTIRVPVQGTDALHLTLAYRRMVQAQDDLTTVLFGICRLRHIDPASVVGFDDERGEFLIRLPS